MAWRLEKSVVGGWLDNRQRGRVCGEIALVGRNDPVRLDLRGNANPDLAGCRIEFTNPHPEPGEPTNLAPLQTGHPGDITASRKVRVLDVPLEEAGRLGKAGQPIPEHRANALYVEWFSRNNGRVVIETTAFEVRVSAPVWRMTRQEIADHAKGVQEAMRTWMEQLDAAVQAEAPAYNPADEEPMDEFGWEKFLRESDRGTERYGKLLEKYMEHPQRDQIIAREMGWTWLEEAQDADEKGVYDDEKLAGVDEESFEIEPNPLTEGRDWVRGRDGRPVHPLVLKAHTLSHELWQDCGCAGLPEEKRNPLLDEMVFNTQCVCAKLAGALHSLPYDVHDAGFVVAMLKRILPYVNQALECETQARAAHLLGTAQLDRFRNDLFVVRDGMLALMERFRRDVS